MGAQLNLVEQNLHLVAVSSRQMLFHIPSSSLFELDGLTAQLIELLLQRPEQTAEQLIGRCLLCPRVWKIFMTIWIICGCLKSCCRRLV